MGQEVHGRRVMQAKNIPEAPVLQFLAGLPRNTPATWYGKASWTPENSVILAMPAGTPEKVALAKMRALIKRGLVEGCGCGCRGDFVITTKGKSHG